MLQDESQCLIVEKLGIPFSDYTKMNVAFNVLGQNCMGSTTIDINSKPAHVLALGLIPIKPTLLAAGLFISAIILCVGQV